MLQRSIDETCPNASFELEEMRNVEVDKCYNKNQMPPTEDGKGILVNISMNLNSLLSIDEPTQVRAKNLDIWNSGLSLPPLKCKNLNDCY